MRNERFTVGSLSAGRMIETAHEFIALTWKVLPFFLIGAIAGAAFQTALLRKGSERMKKDILS